jgi:hypothetical protein
MLDGDCKKLIGFFPFFFLVCRSPSSLSSSSFPPIIIIIIIIICFVGGSSPVDAVAAGLNHAATGAAGKAINGIKVAYNQSGLTGKVSSTLVTTQQPPSTTNHMMTGEIYHSDTDTPPKKVRSRGNSINFPSSDFFFSFPRFNPTPQTNWTRVLFTYILLQVVGHPLGRPGSLIMSRLIFYTYFYFVSFFSLSLSLKGKLPPMIGHDQPSSHNGNRQPGDNKVQLSAGDLLGRTHEELVLLLIQLRRQSSALVKARDACLLEMESQVL